MQVQVKQPHLRVGDLRHRLPVHAHELQQRGQRQARREHLRAVAQHLQVFLGDLLGGQGILAHRTRQPLDQRRLQADLARGLFEGVAGLGARQQFVDIPERQLAALARLPDPLHAVAPLAQPRNDPHVRGSRGRPDPLVLGHEPP